MRYAVAVATPHPGASHGHHAHPRRRAARPALVGELTVVDANGRPVTYPLIPLYDGERDLPDVLDPVQPQARAHRRQPEGRRSRSPTRSRSAAGPTAPRSRATPGSSRRTRTAAGSGCCRSGRRRSRRSSRSSRRASRCRCSSSGRSSRSRHAASLYWSDGDAEPAGRHGLERGGRVMTAALMRRSTPELDARDGLDKLATYPVPDR